MPKHVKGILFVNFHSWHKDYNIILGYILFLKSIVHLSLTENITCNWWPQESSTAADWHEETKCTAQSAQPHHLRQHSDVNSHSGSKHRDICSTEQCQLGKCGGQWTGQQNDTQKNHSYCHLMNDFHQPHVGHPAKQNLANQVEMDIRAAIWYSSMPWVQVYGTRKKAGAKKTSTANQPNIQ